MSKGSRALGSFDVGDRTNNVMHKQGRKTRYCLGKTQMEQGERGAGFRAGELAPCQMELP
jgi:hypothetical protein